MKGLSKGRYDETFAGEDAKTDIVSKVRLPLGDVFEDMSQRLLHIRKFSREFNFREASHMRSFVKIKPSRNGVITLSFTNTVKSCSSREYFTSQICLLTLFAKIKFSRKSPNLQLTVLIWH